MKVSNIKLTLRLPAALHEKLHQRARATDRSLNTAAIEAIQNGLEKEIIYPESDREKVQRMLRESGLWQPSSSDWHKSIGDDIPLLSHKELREKLKGVPPLSDIILEDREPHE